MNILMYLHNGPSLDPIIISYLKKYSKVYTIGRKGSDLEIANDAISPEELKKFIENKKITHFLYSENSSYIPLFLNEFPDKITKVMFLIDTHINKKRRLPYLSLFDLVLLVNKHQVKELKKYNPNIEWLTYGADTNSFYKYKSKKIHDVAFDGNIIPWIHYHRFFMLFYLKMKGIKVYYPKTTYHEHNKIYNESKILINRSPLGGWNLRIFESLATGSLLITDKTDNDMGKIFINKKHLVYFNSFKDLKEKIDYYLVNTREREKIARQGNHFVIRNYSWDRQVKKMLKILKDHKYKKFKREAYYKSLFNLECYSFRNQRLAFYSLNKSREVGEINSIQCLVYKLRGYLYLKSTEFLIYILNIIRTNILIKPFENK